MTERSRTAAEDEFLRALDDHDRLVHRCVDGELTFWEFEATYESFYPRYPLDGHESGPVEREILDKLEPRVALHRDIWERVLTKVVRDEYAEMYGRVGSGFITSRQAVRRLKELLELHSR
ncbi:MAG: hypothetical protein WBV82_18985 [Myxococcaceae bacterium]